MKPIARKVAWAAVYLYAGCLVTYLFLHFGGLDFNLRVPFDEMVNGTAAKPYVGRMLVPMIIHGIDTFSPDGLKSAVISVFISKFFLPDFQGFTGYEPNLFTTCVFIILAVAMYAGAAFGGRAAFIALYGKQGFVANVVGLLYVLCIPLWFRYNNYIYDPMTILLVTWILYAAARGNVWLCCVLFAFACVNKETAILLLPVIVFGIYKTRHRYVALGAGLGLFVVYVLVQAYRSGHFDANKGAWLEPHLGYHQASLLSDFPVSFFYALFVMVVLFWLALSGIRRKPFILVLGLGCTFLPLFIGSIFYGYVDEIRALYDSYPFLLMLAMPTALALLGAGSASQDVVAG